MLGAPEEIVNGEAERGAVSGTVREVWRTCSSGQVRGCKTLFHDAAVVK
jgi:hypothetical protein